MIKVYKQHRVRRDERLLKQDISFEDLLKFCAENREPRGEADPFLSGIQSLNHLYAISLQHF